MTPPLIRTVGYAAATLDGLLAVLERAGVRRLIDVRAVAASRRAGFAKTALREALEARGIAYEHARAFGTPKAGRDAAKAGRLVAFRAVYADLLATPEAEAALSALAEAARAEPVCLLCLEREPGHCHRGIIADRLAERFGFAVEHLDATPAADA